MSLQVRAFKRLDSFTLNVDMQVAPGITALLGPSGAGKTTLLNLIAGLDEPDGGYIELAGEVFYDGSAQPPRKLPPHRRRVGYVFQHPALFPHLNVWQNITYGAGSPSKRHEQVAHLLQTLRLQGLEHRRVQELSGGQQQRVALARALLTGPRLLLMDEPFSALDNLIRQRLRRDILQLGDLADLPIIFVTHDLDEAFTLGQRVAVMDMGRVLQYGPREEVYYRPATRRVARFVGMRNILDGRVTGAGPQGIAVQGEGFELFLPAAQASLRKGESITLGIRPEQIAPASGQEAGNVVTGVIAQVIPEGSQFRLLVRLGKRDYDLEVLLPLSSFSQAGWRPGQPASFYLHLSHLWQLH